MIEVQYVMVMIVVSLCAPIFVSNHMRHVNLPLPKVNSAPRHTTKLPWTPSHHPAAHENLTQRPHFHPPTAVAVTLQPPLQRAPCSLRSSVSRKRTRKGELPFGRLPAIAAATGSRCWTAFQDSTHCTLCTPVGISQSCVIGRNCRG